MGELQALSLKNWGGSGQLRATRVPTMTSNCSRAAVLPSLAVHRTAATSFGTSSWPPHRGQAPPSPSAAWRLLPYGIRYGTGQYGTAISAVQFTRSRNQQHLTNGLAFQRPAELYGTLQLTTLSTARHPQSVPLIGLYITYGTPLPPSLLNALITKVRPRLAKGLSVLPRLSRTPVSCCLCHSLQAVPLFTLTTPSACIPSGASVWRDAGPAAALPPARRQRTGRRVEVPADRGAGP